MQLRLCLAAVCFVARICSAQAATVDSFSIQSDEVLSASLPASAPTAGIELHAKHDLALMFGDKSHAIAIADRGMGSSLVPGGFFIRDAKAKGPIIHANMTARRDGRAVVQKGEIDRLGLKLTARFEPSAEGIDVSGAIEDMTGEDRAISLYYGLSVSRENLVWHDDVRSSRPIAEGIDFVTSKTLAAGAVGGHSFYPICAVSNPESALSLSIPMDRPSLYRLAYSRSAELLYVVFDFGLTRDTRKFPGEASFKFTIAAVDSKWGFRSALERYYAANPAFFDKRVKQEGIWVYADLRAIENVGDFGVMFHEANIDRGAPNEKYLQGATVGAFSKNFHGPEAEDALAFDDKHGIFTFRYSTPMPLNIEMPQPKPKRNYELLLKAIEEVAKRPDAQGLRARAQEACGLKDENQKFVHNFVDLGWVKGARTIQNPDPDLPNTPENPNRAFANYDPEDKEDWYQDDGTTGNSDPKLDGEYLDSLGVFTDKLNFARDQFAASDFPLTFSTRSGQPCLVQEWSLAEFCAWLSNDLRSKGKMIMSNFYPKTFPFSCMYIDAMGTETGWNEKDAVCNYYRSMSNQKPFLMLVNGDFTRMSHEMIRQGMQRGMFYGFYPSLFNGSTTRDGQKVRLRYFEMPDLYNRDRDLFKKYVPLIRRISTAGWQPVTGARSNDPAVWVERWGSIEKGDLLLTVFNSAKKPKRVELALDDTPVMPGALSASGISRKVMS